MSLHLVEEPAEGDRLPRAVMVERENAALRSTIRNLEHVVEDCVLRLHELGDHETADQAEKNARSGF